MSFLLADQLRELSHFAALSDKEVRSDLIRLLTRAAPFGLTEEVLSPKVKLARNFSFSLRSVVSFFSL